MQIHNLRELAEFDDKKPVPKVLMNRPGYRLVLLNLRRGQRIPEHSAKEVVTVYAISGHITFFEAGSPFELRAGQVLFIEGSLPHALEAHEDSTLLVVAAGDSVPAANPLLDLREVPHVHRHPLVFSQFDALGVGEAFELINDHDPVPLHRQMDVMRPAQAEWSYIERGPERFHICVTRVAPPSGVDTPVKAQSGALVGLQR